MKLILQIMGLQLQKHLQFLANLENGHFVAAIGSPNSCNNKLLNQLRWKIYEELADLVALGAYIDHGAADFIGIVEGLAHHH